MSKIDEVTLIIFKELLSRHIHGLDKDAIKDLYKMSEEIAIYILNK